MKKLLAVAAVAVVGYKVVKKIEEKDKKRKSDIAKIKNSIYEYSKRQEVE